MHIHQTNKYKRSQITMETAYNEAGGSYKNARYTRILLSDFISTVLT